MAGEIHVRGLAELQRAFAKADKTLITELKDGLRDAAEPVRRDAEQLASERITNITAPWEGMRIGVTRKSVYVAPRKRATRVHSRKRPNLADLLLGEAMLPALDRNIADVERRIDDVLAEVGKAWERA